MKKPKNKKRIKGSGNASIPAAVLAKIRADISASTIPAELKALYEIANATELISTQAFERIKGAYARNGYRCEENEMLKGINDYCKAVRKATFFFYQRIDPAINGATVKDGGVKAYNWFNSDTNELCRLLLLYIDRTARNNDNYAEVFETLTALPSCNIYNAEDIQKYTLNLGTPNDTPNNTPNGEGNSDADNG